MNVYDKKVLIVDDEPGIIKLVKLQLQQAGFKPENIYERRAPRSVWKNYRQG
jgi:DNA-binding response OmpR family regulator